MAEQPELDLPAPPISSAQASGKTKRALFAGLSWLQMLGGLLLLAAIVWGMWVTRTILAPPEDHIVSARLSAIVGEYVQAQARSTAPPAQVEAEMRAFMASLDKELQRRGASGQVVLVGEAVLTKNVPDITESLKKAVYASGVPRPHQASAEELERLNAQMMAATQPQLGASGQTAGQTPDLSAPIDPMAGAMPGAQSQQPAARRYAPPGASVSTFGGSDGNGGQ